MWLGITNVPSDHCDVLTWKTDLRFFVFFLPKQLLTHSVQLFVLEGTRHDEMTSSKAQCLDVISQFRCNVRFRVRAGILEFHILLNVLETVFTWTRCFFVCVTLILFVCVKKIKLTVLWQNFSFLHWQYYLWLLYKKVWLIDDSLINVCVVRENGQENTKIIYLLFFFMWIISGILSHPLWASVFVTDILVHLLFVTRFHLHLNSASYTYIGICLCMYLWR